MFSSLLVAVTVTAPAAPVPKDAVPNTTGPAPRVVAVKADGSGSVWITAQIAEKRMVQQQFFVMENGQQVLKQREVEQVVYNHVRKTIGEFGGKFTTADGVTFTTEEATKRLKDGATLLITADGKPVDKGWLRAVAPDAVIMVAEGLGHAYFLHDQGYETVGPLPKTAAPRLVMLRADETGAVKVATNPNGGGNPSQIYYDGDGAIRVVRGRAVVLQGVDFDGSLAPAPTASNSKKLLADVKFDAYDTDGKLVSRTEALKRLKAGGLVLLAGDNRFPDPDHLKAFRDDILVLVSGEFIFPMNVPNPYDMPMKSSEPAKGGEKTAQPVPAVGVAAPAAQLKLAVAIERAAAAAERAEAAEKAAAAEKAKAEEKAKEKPAEKKPEANPIKP